MNIHPIKTENDYRNTLQEIEGLMMAKTGSIEGDRLDVLVTLVEDYERKHYPIDFPDPIEAIKFAMEQRSLTVKDFRGVAIFAKACFGHPSPSKQQKLNATTYASGGPDSSSSPRPDPTRGRNIGSK
ncbi:helix-turn-helix domain-containing protein [Bathymodiolus platifrons methanotrophic gill symbiont]|uniref:helix-turn-helix domain-containing protein n=1 Tax=Bathymodiolus platifrons methanotrophic gill symbiont TaxID=113268 RepID=UPI001C8D5544|nr:hypothetical protein [Bathymodiolus platifrons methanotrophic gill symbiont]